MGDTALESAAVDIGVDLNSRLPTKEEWSEIATF